MRPVRAAVVAVPARDEAATVAACLDAVVAAAAAAGLPCVVAVAADSCSDATVPRARAALARGRRRTGGLLRGVVVEGRWGSAGGARAAAAAAGLALLDVPPEEAWLATTDADTLVAPDWLATHVRWSRHVDGVAGLVEVDWSAIPLPAAAHVVERLAARHAASVEAGGTGLGHQHVHGANLGVRASLWLAVGGCGPLLVGEDHELWRRLRQVGAVLLGVTDLTVRTSGRLAGRAPHGFAAHLAALRPHHAVVSGGGRPRRR